MALYAVGLHVDDICRHGVCWENVIFNNRFNVRRFHNLTVCPCGIHLYWSVLDVRINNHSLQTGTVALTASFKCQLRYHDGSCAIKEPKKMTSTQLETNGILVDIFLVLRCPCTLPRRRRAQKYVFGQEGARYHNMMKRTRSVVKDLFGYRP